MTLANLFMTSTRAESPLDGSQGTPGTAVSEFLTVQSLTNFAVMTAAIDTAWHVLPRLDPRLAGTWVPFVFAALWGIASLWMSREDIKKKGSIVASIFIAAINALVLASAVLGTAVATS